MRIVLINLCFLFTIHSLIGQEKIIDLYENSIPCNSNLSLEIEYENEYRIFKKISKPQIWYYPTKEFSNKTPGIIIVPGGGYSFLSFDKEGIEIAKWLNSIGISAFVLKHRLPHWETGNCKKEALFLDGKKAIQIVRSRSNEFNIDPNKIGVIGFSAGGHLASMISSDQNFIDKKKDDGVEQISSRLDFSILVYPVITMEKNITNAWTKQNLLGKNPDEDEIIKFSSEYSVNKNTPPTILIHSSDDKTVSPENSIRYYQALKKFNVPTELHIWEKGGHGYGISQAKGPIKIWPNVVKEWLGQRKIL